MLKAWGAGSRLRLAGALSDGSALQCEGGQALDQLLAIAGTGQALVIAVDMGLILFGADGSPHPLRQADGSGWNNQFVERIAATAAQPFGAGFAYRVIGRGKRQLGDEQ